MSNKLKIKADDIEVGSELYEALINKEANHESKKAYEHRKYGIPITEDFRRIYRRPGVNLPLSLSEIHYNKEMLELVRGKSIHEMISTAVKKGGKCLDLGCGMGWLSLELSREGLDVFSIDVSPGAIAIAKKNAQNDPYHNPDGNLNYKVADLNKFKLGIEKYDVITANAILHHILDLENLMMQILKALKHEGLFITIDNIGTTYVNELINRIGCLITAFYLPYPKAIKKEKIIRKSWKFIKFVIKNAFPNFKVKSFLDINSPFESIRTHEIPPALKRNFKIIKWREEVCLYLILVEIANSSSSISRRIQWMKRVLAFDRALIRSGLCKGESLFAVMQKN